MQNKKITIILCILNVIKSFLLISQALASKLLIEDAMKKKDILFSSCLLSGLVLGLILICVIYQLIKKKGILKIEVKLKKDIFSSLIKKDIQELRKYHSGEITNVYLNDLSNILEGEMETIPNLFLYTSRFIFALFAMIYIDWRLLIILFIAGLFGLVFAYFYSKIMKKFAKASLESDGKVNAFMQEGYENIKLIKAFSSENNVIKFLNKRLNINYTVKNKRNNLSLIGNVGINSLMNFTFIFTMIYGCYGIYNNTMGYGDLLVLTELVSYFEAPLSMFSSVISRLAVYKVSKIRINKLFNLKDDENINNIDDFDRIEINNISFSYDKPIYENFSYIINKGDKILLKGPSGKGKTTLFQLLLGFIKANEGEISLYKDDVKYNIASCRNIFAYVPQENILFSGTIKENIDLFIDNYTEDELNNALKCACIYDEIMSKKDGLDSQLIERGGGLSLGQIQRLLLAIALLKNRPILLLDEFTSSLDKELEKKIIENISKLDQTMIIITHRDININNAKTLYL